MQTNSRLKLNLCSRALCLGLVVALSGCSESEAGGTEPSGLKADLQAGLDEVVAQQISPGVALHFASGSGETGSLAAGVGDVVKHVPLAPNAHFRAGSVIKTFVATAVLQAVEAGKLGLDDVLTERLPPAVTARIPNAEKIQIRMLLSHRSGIADWQSTELEQVVAADREHVWSLEEILALVEQQPPMFEPGARYTYSNTNYNLLSEILSNVSGRSWREVIRRQIFARAGLHHTSLPEPGDLTCPRPCAHGYEMVEGELVDFSRVDPSMAGGSGGHALITTSADLTRFFQALRSGALFKQRRTLDTMFAFQLASDPEIPIVGYGLGVMQLDVNGTTVIGHLGGTAGYQTFMLYVPATDRYMSGFINVRGDFGAVLVRLIERMAAP